MIGTRIIDGVMVMTRTVSDVIRNLSKGCSLRYYITTFPWDEKSLSLSTGSNPEDTYACIWYHILSWGGKRILVLILSHMGNVEKL